MRASKSVYDFAQALDAVVPERRFLGPEASIARYEVIGDADRKTLGEHGAVGEMLCNVYDDQGRIVDHPLNQLRDVGPARGGARRARFGCWPQAARTSSRRSEARSSCSSRRITPVTDARRRRGGLPAAREAGGQNVGLT